MKSHCQLLIIGAGAGGIGAAYAAAKANMDYLVIEASHRVGGRGLTEELAPGIPWDLGCHWLHSGSINPLASIADQLGMHYDKNHPTRGFYMNGDRLAESEVAKYDEFGDAIFEQVERASSNREDMALSEYIDYSSQWAPYYCYWQSLMTSTDVDNFSALDLVNYEDTDENWPVTDGYGSLLVRQASNLAIELNTTARTIDYSQGAIKVTTNRGMITTDRVIITVSTGVLNGRDIAFHPVLPIAKQEAIAALPLGTYNNFAMLYDEEWPFDPETPDRIDYSNGDDINFAFKLKCSGWPYIYCAVAGRQAQWLENQPQSESESLMMSALTDTFGSAFKNKITKFRTSAWGNDPLIKGAYSASQPGQANQRKSLATPINDQLYFAGEAASVSAYATAHGAWQSGADAVQHISQSP